MENGGTVLTMLAYAVRAFAQTPQFQFLRNTPFARVLNSSFDAESWPGNLTFAELSGTPDSELDRLIAEFPDLARDLLTFLKPHLGEGGPPPQPRVDYGEELRYADDEAPFMGSIEAELKYDAALQRLTSLPNWADVGTMKLGEFWSEEWIPSPFEEAFLLRQLPGLDVKNLLRKKMSGPKGVLRLIGAMHRAADILLAEAPPVRAPDPDAPATTVPPPVAPVHHSTGHVVSPPTSQTKTYAPPPSDPIAPAPAGAVRSARRWERIPEEIGPALRAVLHHVEEQGSRCAQSDVPLAKLVRDLPIVFTAEQMLVQAFTLDMDAERASGVLGIEFDNIVSLAKDGARILASAFESVNPATAASWRAALGGAGVPATYFSAALDSLPCNADFKATLQRMLLRAFGAESFRLTGTGGTMYWTTSKERFDILSAHLLSLLPLELEPFKARIDALLPLLNYHELLDHFADRIENDEGIWRKRSKKGKGRK